MDREKQKTVLNVLIVEDNYDDMEYLCILLQQIRPETTLYKTGKAAKAPDIICRESIDLILLDVELPDMDGFSLAGRIRSMEGYELTPMVFVTASGADPLSAHKKYHCYDYIKNLFLKKFFKKIISPLLEGINQQKETSSHTDRKKEKVILLETKEEMNIVKFDDILFAEINGRVITVFLTGNRSITGIRMRFEDFIRYVNSSDFIRCHKSYAVNVRKIETIRKIDYRSADIIFKDDAADGEVPAAGKAKCIISKTYHDEVLEAVQSRG